MYSSQKCYGHRDNNSNLYVYENQVQCQCNTLYLDSLFKWLNVENTFFDGRFTLQHNIN